MDKPVNIKLLSDMHDIVAERNQYDNMQYTAKAKNIGKDYPQKEEGGYLIRSNQEFDFVMSEALYKHISLYDKNSNIMVVMKKTGSDQNKAGFVWEVKPAEINKPENKFDNGLAIKWGMAFNNATRLVSSIPLHSDETPQDRVNLIKDLTPKMFEIACSMPEEPKKEEPKKEEAEDDLSF